MRQLNDVVWSLDARNDHLADLVNRMRDYAYDVLGTVGLEVHFEAPAGLLTQRLSALLRRNLYLIYKESLHNILKHAASATRVAVQVRLEPGALTQLVLEVLDNGQTTPAANRAPCYSRRTGQGLRNIKERAQAMGTASCESISEGFCIRVAVPLLSGWKAYGRKKKQTTNLGTQ
ncbi:sensor histidine kinase [Hymenobacter cavernae]|uniref:histidine kinase n=1 Tax=Hymenobacter cavernae TaxID=2044852 RepID=A0ABQ1UNX2_9BACT|nr:ATP-binding protein [Hymenobacter cavernae]GGF21837.1 hypothetical protein GCM10011383_36830 [Hymenobacter cavernae]